LNNFENENEMDKENLSKDLNTIMILNPKRDPQNIRKIKELETVLATISEKITSYKSQVQIYKEKTKKFKKACLPYIR